ncbi:cell wall-binding repeat-containing protein [Candidatus Poriferisodalis sp.]|uniref:cell wall-binding repeat-containing protein n=1 Tax=Candidatus Poriferisodalis sp. TaxID=3101277 RepID=UPI003AF90A0D
MLRKVVGAVCAAAMTVVLPVLPSAVGAQSAQEEVLAKVAVTRYGGADRYDTSLLVAEAYASEAGGQLESVVMVSGRSWPDAVVAAPVAGALGAPVLMTPPGELRADAAAFLRRTGVSSVVVVGTVSGADAVGAAVTSALEGLDVSVERVGRADRYGTGVVAARRVTPGVMPGEGTTAIVASGEVFADALVAGPFAARGRHPVLLTPRDRLHPGVEAHLSGAGIDHVVLMGGRGALSEAVENSITALGISVTRLAGATRFDTAVLAAELVRGRYSEAAGEPCFATEQIGLARARVPFDSFSAAPLLGRLCAPLLLTSPGSIPLEVAGFLDAARASASADTLDLRVFGGESAVSQAAIDAYLRPADTVSTASYQVPDGPRGDNTFLDVSRGRTCVVRLDGSVTCWGVDGFRERLTTAGLSDVVALGAADTTGYLTTHSCAVHADGTVSCWGNGRSGKLGQGNSANHYVPVKVPRITDAVAVAGSLDTTCAVHRDDSVSCWGSNLAGEAGASLDIENVFTPSQFPRLADVAAISAGRQTFCAVHRDGGVSCWGVVRHASPVDVRGIPPATSVSVGLNQSCAVTTAGEVFCWRDHDTFQTQKVEGLQGVVSVAVGDASACALHRDGGVSCWGDNSVGQLGDGTTAGRSAPRRIAGVYDAVDVGISMSSEPIPAHACALHRDGGVSCWGDNSVGQLGDGTTAKRLRPVRAQQFAPIPAADVAITSLEVLRTWGDQVALQWQTDHPWLKKAWDTIRNKTRVSESGFGGTVWHECDIRTSNLTCSAVEMNMSEMSLGGLVHELVHVYDHQTGLAPGKAWGAVQLYFANKYPDCYWGDPGTEILADTVTHLMVPHAWLTYYSGTGCPSLGARPSLEDEQVVLDGLAGRVPDWYTKNITTGEEFWAAWLKGPSLRTLINLAPEFGGLCSDEWIRFPLDPELFPAADSDPFRDGGC